MRFRLACLVVMSSICSVTSALGLSGMDLGIHRIALQGSISTGGNLGVGLIDFTEKTELGISVSGKMNNASKQTKTITPVIFGGLRKALGENTYFAYGVDFASIFGRDQGQTINSDYSVGPFVSLEQMLTTHVMLTGWILPYQYQYQKKAGLSTSTHSFFGAGGIGINYLF